MREPRPFPDRSRAGANRKRVDRTVDSVKASIAAISSTATSFQARHGTVTTTLVSTSYAVTFSSPMPSASYDVFLQAKSGVSIQLWPSSFTVNGFTLNLSVGVAATFSYLAIKA